MERADRPHRPRRGPGRFLAPAALIAVVIALIVIVAGAGQSSTSTPVPVVTETTIHRTSTATSSGTATRSGTSTQTAQPATTAATGTSSTQTSTVGTYTIASGDTFGVIASKTGVSVATIEKLNPGVSSTSLTVGQVIKLK